MTLWEEYLVTRRTLIWCDYYRCTEPMGSLLGYFDNWMELNMICKELGL